MGTKAVVIGEIRGEHSPEMPVVEDDDMIEHLAMERRDRNQVEMEAMRIATMGGMIRNPILSSEQIREIASLKHDHDWSRCQEFQPMRVFGTHRRLYREAD